MNSLGKDRVSQSQTIFVFYIDTYPLFVYRQRQPMMVHNIIIAYKIV